MPGWKRGAESSTLVIDIGTGSLKLLEIEKTKDNPVINKFYIEDFPPEIQERPSLEKEFLTQCIKDALAKAGIKSKSVILVLPDYITDLVLLTVPKQTKEELKTSLKWEIKDHISFPVEEAAFDYRIVSEFKEMDVPKMSLFVACVSKKEIEKYLQILSELRLESVSLTIGFTSFGPVVKNSGLIEEGENFVAVDLGAKTTKLGVFKEDYLQFFRKVDLGSREITLALMNEETDFNKAEDIKRKVGISPVGEESEGVSVSETEVAQRNFGLTRPILERISSEIGQFSSFYKESLKGGRINKLFIFGGGTKLKGLKTFISSALQTDVFLPNPFAEIKTEGLDALRLQEDSATLTRAWGAFIKGAKFINLLPDEIKFKKKIKLEHILIRSTACIAAGILALFYIVAAIKGTGLTKKLSIEKLQYEELGPAMEKMNKLEQEKDLLQKRMDLCVGLLTKEPFWEDLLKETGRLIPGNIILNKINIKKAGAKREEEFMFTSAKAKEKEGVILMLEGTVYPSEFTLERSLTGFLTSLSESPLFYETKLNITKENKVDDKIVLDFIIQSQVYPPKSKIE